MTWLGGKVRAALRAARFVDTPMKSIDGRDTVAQMPALEGKLESWNRRLIEVFGADQACIQVQDAFMSYVEGIDDQEKATDLFDMRINSIEDPERRLRRTLTTVLKLENGGVNFLVGMDERLDRWEAAEHG